MRNKNFTINRMLRILIHTLALFRKRAFVEGNTASSVTIGDGHSFQPFFCNPICCFFFPEFSVASVHLDQSCSIKVRLIIACAVTSLFQFNQLVYLT